MYLTGEDLIISMLLFCRFDSQLKRTKFDCRQDSQHFQQQQPQHNSHFSQHSQNSSSSKQPLKPPTPQPPAHDPYEFTDESSSLFGTLPARNFRTSRDDLFRSSPLKVSTNWIMVFFSFPSGFRRWSEYWTNNCKVTGSILEPGSFSTLSWKYVHQNQQ